MHASHSKAAQDGKVHTIAFRWIRSLLPVNVTGTSQRNWTLMQLTPHQNCSVDLASVFKYFLPDVDGYNRGICPVIPSRSTPSTGRANDGQDQALQTHRATLREDGKELCPEAQMRRIKPYFPLSHGIVRVDDRDRRVVSGIVLVASCGGMTF
jgi:hypothetical protein